VIYFGVRKEVLVVDIVDIISFLYAFSVVYLRLCIRNPVW